MHYPDVTAEMAEGWAALWMVGRAGDDRSAESWALGQWQVPRGGVMPLGNLVMAARGCAAEVGS